MDRNLVPRSLVILGKRVKIVVKELEDNHGEFHSDKMTIFLDKNQSNEEAAHTLYHECIHAVAYISGWHFLVSPEMEEMIVRSIEHGLGDLLYFKSKKK